MSDGATAMYEEEKCKSKAGTSTRTSTTSRPMPNDLPAIWELVIDDMESRDHVGTMRYGTQLQPHNGRDAWPTRIRRH